jgi:hypothetical protein
MGGKDGLVVRTQNRWKRWVIVNTQDECTITLGPYRDVSSN